MKSASKIQSKLDNKGKPCVFVGYPTNNHAGNVYRFFTTDTNRIIHSWDVQWLNMMWKKYAKLKQQETDSDSEELQNPNTYEVLMDSDGEDENNPATRAASPTSRVTRSGRGSNPTEAVRTNTASTPTTPRMSRELKGLHTYYNPILGDNPTENPSENPASEDPMQVDENADPEGLEEENAANAMEHAFLAMLTGAMDPVLFDEAYYADDPNDRTGWRSGIAKEFNDMKKRGVWEKVKKKNIPEGANLLGCKWVFKKKKNGVYRARLVAKSYD